MVKEHKIRYSAIHAARFETYGEDGNDSSLGPVVIWIAVQPGSATADDTHRASPHILTLLQANGVHGAVVEWFEGAVESLSGPPLLRVAPNNNPTYRVRRFLSPGLGMPIATERYESAHCEGSVAFFFHEAEDSRGNVSGRVLGVSNCHVLREDTTVPYSFNGAGQPPQHVLIANLGRFQRGVDEIKSTIARLQTEADRLLREIDHWKTKLQSDEADEVEEAQSMMDTTQTLRAKIEEDIMLLQTFDKDVNDQWADRASRTIGQVDWAPAKSIQRCSNDIGTFEVDADKFRAQFKGNVVELGGKFTPLQVSENLGSHTNSSTVFKYPFNRQLRIQGCVAPELLALPDTYDSKGRRCIVVMKDGGATDLTFGRYAGLEAYASDDFGAEYIELPIYNYDYSENFASKGDSGSLIFDSQGRMVSILHAGLVKEGDVLVTYATPAWWAVEQLQAQYPHADFDRKSY